MTDRPEKIEKPLVAIASGGGARQNIREAMTRLDLSRLRGRSVLVKPNAGRMMPPNSGVNTSPEAVAGCLDVLSDAGAARIAIGESPLLGIDTIRSLEKCGIAGVARERGVELLDLDADPPDIRDLPTGCVIRSIKVCRRVRDFDFVVSLPVMKTHMHTGVTLSLKNMKGVLYKRQKVQLHQLPGREKAGGIRPLDAAIRDVLHVILPHLAVIDGSIGMEGLGPSAGAQKKANLAVASFDPVAADSVACRLMGIDPAGIAHIRLAAESGFGVMAPEAMRVIPSDFTTLVTPFAAPPRELALAFPDVAIYEAGACSACISTTMLFLQRFKDSIQEYRLEDGKLHMALGKDVKEVPTGTIVIGNCAARHKHRGPFAKGCPPVASRIYKAVTGKEPDEPVP